MRTLIALAVFVVLLVAGVAWFVVGKEQQRERGAAAGAQATGAPVATISTGERVDVAAHVPSDGYCVVFFTADF